LNIIVRIIIHNYYVDIDECLVNNGGCESTCTNLEGVNNTTGLGYQCGCDYGYQIAPDNHNCNGMYGQVHEPTYYDILNLDICILLQLGCHAAVIFYCSWVAMQLWFNTAGLCLS